jgi:PAS domain S-box-containing protein
MDFRAYEAAPGISVIVVPDPPVYTLVTASDDFLRVTGLARNEVAGKGFFEILFTSMDDPDLRAKENLEASFRNIIKNHKQHALPTQTYGLSHVDGTYSQRHWKISNAPIIYGGEVQYIIHSATDITDLIATQQRIEAAQGMEKAYSLFMNAPVIIGILRTDEYLIDLANEGLLEVWGRTADVIGKPLLTAIPELKEQGFIELLDNVRATGQPFYAYEFPITLNRNGVDEILYFDFVYKPIYENETDRKASGIISVGHEVTAQVLAKKKLEESEQRVRSIVESAPFPIAVYHGREMRITLANRSILQAWDRREDIIGKLYSEVLPELENQQIYEQLDKVYTTGIPFHARNQRVDLNVKGKLQTFYFNYSFTPLFDSSGKVYGVMNTGADVTDLIVAKQMVEQSEQNFRNMILQAPVAMCILLGPEHVIEVANPAIIEIWGKPAKNVIGKPVFDALPDARDQGLEQLLRDVYETGESFKANEHPVNLVRNGQMQTVYQNFVYDPYRDVTGKILGVLAISIDVTEQVLARQKIEDIVKQRTKELAHANETLRITNYDLMRSNENLQQFAYAASHDLKEPLRKIQYFTDRLKNTAREKLTESENRLFGRIEKASSRMSSLIDDLLTYAQVSLQSENFEDVDLNQLLHVVLNDLDLEIEQKRATVTVHKLFTTKGHFRQLQQAFQNLITNALKYNKKDVPPRISITCQQIDAEDIPASITDARRNGKYYVCEISDNGIGFEQKDADRIFNVFTRLHDTTQVSGTGIGLSIVQKVVENHHGFVTAESDIGQGSRFKLFFPKDPGLH